jgi:hypothetical protein
MDPRLMNPDVFRIEHRHRDGSWGELEPVPHDAAEHDAERAWMRGKVFRCTHCDQQVQVTIEPIDSAPAIA